MNLNGLNGGELFCLMLKSRDGVRGGRKKRFLRVEAKVAFWFAPFNQNGCQSNQTQRILPAHPFHCRFQVSTFFCLPFHFPRIHSSTHYSLSLSIISNKIQLIILFLSSILFQYNFPFLFFSLETKKFQLFFLYIFDVGKIYKITFYNYLNFELWFLVFKIQSFHYFFISKFFVLLCIF